MNGIELSARLKTLLKDKYSEQEVKKILFRKDKDGNEINYSLSGTRNLLKRKTPLKTDILEILCRKLDARPELFFNNRYKSLDNIQYKMDKLTDDLTRKEERMRFMMTEYKEMLEHNQDLKNIREVTLLTLYANKDIMKMLGSNKEYKTLMKNFLIEK